MVPFKMRLNMLLAMVAMVFAACTADPVSSFGPDTKPSEFSLELEGALNKNYALLEEAVFDYEARLRTLDGRQDLLIALAASADGSNLSEYRILQLILPVSSSGFQFAPGNYFVQEDPLIGTWPQAIFIYYQSADEQNFEDYQFTLQNLAITVEEASSSHVKGTMRVDLNQQSGVRSINGIVEDVDLAYEGALRALIVFDLEISPEE